MCSIFSPTTTYVYKNKEQNLFLNIMEKKNFYNFSFLNNYVNISKVQFYSVVCNLIAVVLYNVHTMPLSVWSYLKLIIKTVTPPTKFLFFLFSSLAVMGTLSEQDTLETQRFRSQLVFDITVRILRHLFAAPAQTHVC